MIFIPWSALFSAASAIRVSFKTWADLQEEGQERVVESSRWRREDPTGENKGRGGFANQRDYYGGEESDWHGALALVF